MTPTEELIKLCDTVESKCCTSKTCNLKVPCYEVLRVVRELRSRIERERKAE